jgi:hypothetical protein
MGIFAFYSSIDATPPESALWDKLDLSQVQVNLYLYNYPTTQANIETLFATDSAIINAIGPLGKNIFFINQKEDLPYPVANVIYLDQNATYFFTSTVDLQGDRLECGENTVILGASSENCRIMSTGLVDTLITSIYSLPMRNITIEAALALDLDGDGTTTALDWFGVNFTNCASIGAIYNYSNVILSDCAFLDSGDLTFDGTFGTIGINNSLIDGSSTITSIILPPTLTVSRRFRITYSSFVTLTGETALNISTSAIIPVEGYILDTVNFSGGGTYITGVQHSDNKASFVNCKGISNSAEIANYYMLNNATVSNIITVNTPIKVAGTTLPSSINQRFTHTNNRATYIGAISRNFKVTATISVTSTSANDQVGFYIAKDGVVSPESEMYLTTDTNSRAENVTIQSIVALTTNNFIEIWVENKTDASDVTVTFMNVIIEPLN